MEIIIKSWGYELRQLLIEEKITKSELGIRRDERGYPFEYEVIDEKKFFLAVLQYGISWKYSKGYGDTIGTT